MAERRQAQRRPLDLACTLHRKGGSVVPARSVDIGPGGMRVLTSRPLTTDEVVRYEFLSGGGESTPLQGEARVMRMEGYRRYGLRFEGPTPLGRML